MQPSLHFFLPFAILAAMVLPLAAASSRSLKFVPIFSSNSGVTPPIRKAFVAAPDLIEGLIQAGFSRDRAREALETIKENNIGKAMEWLFEDNKKRYLSPSTPKRDPSTLVCHMKENIDYDGYAVRWGIGHTTQTWQECSEACKKHTPEPPHYFDCNIWVWCGKPRCFAPAAHEFTFGQCWLKHQDDPTHPHVNMVGRYSDEYRRTHPSAPEMVDWTAGVCLPSGTALGAGVPSSRSHWK
eukprot:jgi/Mesvir1/11767/Mv00134-RA.1